MRTIQLRERYARIVRLRRADVDYLLTSHREQIELIPTSERNRYRLTPRGWVGVVHTPSCRLVIQPKIPLSSLSLLLNPDTRMFDEGGEVAANFDHWLIDRFAIRLAALMQERAAQGLHADYVEEHQSGQTLRGRLDLAAQQRESIRGGRQLHGIADLRTVDVPLNQTPLALAEQLRLVPELSVEARTSLERALQNWQGVEPVPGSVCDLLSRAIPAGYETLLEWCRLIEGSMGLGVGTRSEVNILLNLETAFERYLTRGLVAECQDSMVQVGVQTWHRTTPPDFAFHPDIVLLRNGRIAVVVDAKWKTFTAGSLDAGDVQQVLAYAAALGAERAVLVYPGQRNRRWVYALPCSAIRLEIRTLRVSGTVEKCRVSLARLACELRKIAKKTAGRA